MVKSQVDLIRARDRSSLEPILLLSLFPITKIGNSDNNKIGSREVFEHFHEPGSAVDGSSRCIHVFKSVLVLSQVDKIKLQK